MSAKDLKLSFKSINSELCSDAVHPGGIEIKNLYHLACFVTLAKASQVARCMIEPPSAPDQNRTGIAGSANQCSIR